MAFDVVTYILSKSYADKIISMLPRGFIYKGSVSYYKDLPSTAEVGWVYTVVYEGESGMQPWGAEFVCDSMEGGTASWLELGGDYKTAIEKLKEELKDIYLPMTAGSTKPLTGNLYISTASDTNPTLFLKKNNNTELRLEGQSESSLVASTNGVLYLRTKGESAVQNTNCSVKLSHNDSAVSPELNNTTSLGTETCQWKNVYAKNVYQDGDKVATQDSLTAESTARAAADNTLQSNIDLKQDILVSGTNIKTVDNQSILGSGNITTTAIIGRDFTTKNTVGGIPANTPISASETLASLIYRILGQSAPVHEYKAYFYEGLNKPATISTSWSTITVTEEVKNTGLVYNIIGGIQGYLGIAFNKALTEAKAITQNDFTLNFLDAPSDFECSEVTYDGETYIMYIAKEIAILSNGDKYKVSWKA